MTFIIVAFDYPDTSYIRLGDVLVKSIKMNCPGSDIIYHKCKAPKVPEEERELKRFGENAEKLRIWFGLLNKCKDDEIILIDSDTMVLRDISEVFNNEFDIGCTVRTRKSRIKYNGGVMFVKKNSRSMAFFRKFRDIDDMMYADRAFHEIWRAKYSGMNQAAFGWMIENYKEEISVMEFPCAIYNALSDDWRYFVSGFTKIVHLKSKLRDVVLNNLTDKFQNIKKIWQQIEVS